MAAAKRRMVNVSLRTHRKLQRISRLRGWKYAVAVDRLCDRELRLLTSEGASTTRDAGPSEE